MSTTFEPRRARPGEAFEYADSEGTLQTFKADSKGLLRPKSAEEQAVCDVRDLPVARVTTTRSKSKAAAATPAAEDTDTEKEG